MPIRIIPSPSNLPTFGPVWVSRYAEQMLNDIDEPQYFAVRQTGFDPQTLSLMAERKDDGGVEITCCYYPKIWGVLGVADTMHFAFTPLYEPYSRVAEAHRSGPNDAHLLGPVILAAVRAAFHEFQTDFISHIKTSV